MARRELGPASLAVVQAVAASLTPTDASLLVACSGGADSLALAFAARRTAERSGRGYGAVVVDHGLQPASADVAERTRSQLTELGYADVAVVPVQVAGDGGPEAAARAARYAALESAALARHATVLLGHTLDDQAETVLLGLARGSGIRSLGGMAPRVRHLLRPLLSVRRQTTVRACEELRLVPWQDPHNFEGRFARVRVRDAVLPVLEAELGPGMAEALGRTADLARDDADLLDALTAEADPGHDELDCALLLDLPRPLRRRLIRRWLLRHGALEVTLERVLAVESLVTDWHGQGPLDLPGRTVTRRDDRLHVSSSAGH